MEVKQIAVAGFKPDLHPIHGLIEPSSFYHSHIAQINTDVYKLLISACLYTHMVQNFGGVFLTEANEC